MKKLNMLMMAIVIALLLVASAQGYNSPFISNLGNDVVVTNSIDLGYGDLDLRTGENDYKGPSLITYTDMIGDNDGYGYGHAVVGDGDDLPYVNQGGWEFDNRSAPEIADPSAPAAPATTAPS